MSSNETDRAPSEPGQRFPALLWALLHAPVILFLYFPAVSAAVRSVPGHYRAALWPTFVPQVLLLALGTWLLTLPLSRWRRGYRWAAPAVSGLATAALALDSQVYRGVGFHLNGFFFRVLIQPTALSEVGLTGWMVAQVVAVALALVALDAAAGAWFIRRRPSRRRTWTVALALLLLSAAERVYGETLAHVGGRAVFAASGVLPLQAPLRFEGVANLLFGKARRDPFAGADTQRLPTGVDTASIRFTRRPDVVFAVSESTPFDHLDEKTMPALWARASHGTRFTRHYSTASATHYALFSLFYGLQAQKLEATVGAGRRPVIFPAFRANGYDVHALTASCVDWMDLKETVFGGMGSTLETWCHGSGLEVDEEMVARAREVVRATPADQPLFLFVFFDVTHFGYPRAEQDRIFLPEWDGMGGIKVTSAPGWTIKNRARNAAHTLDRLLDGLLSDVEKVRGRAPLVFYTGDHGEEFRQKGHIAHGSDVTDEQIHVPAAFFGPGVPQGVVDVPTSHADVTPTLLALLGDTHPPSLYADGLDMFHAPPDRFVVATVGWEPRYAVIGKDLKVRMYAGGSAEITDPDDKPLPDGSARMAANAARILRALRGEAEPAAPAPAAAVHAKTVPARD